MLFIVYCCCHWLQFIKVLSVVKWFLTNIFIAHCCCFWLQFIKVLLGSGRPVRVPPSSSGNLKFCPFSHTVLSAILSSHYIYLISNKSLNFRLYIALEFVCLMHVHQKQIKRTRHVFRWSRRFGPPCAYSSPCNRTRVTCFDGSACDGHTHYTPIFSINVFGKHWTFQWCMVDFLKNNDVGAASVFLQNLSIFWKFQH